ncbi:MAG: hypothetical protein KC423_22080 [Anaerolineales bacterium]|nr:hypothetical protein [Anaerolineales bacterium]
MFFRRFFIGAFLTLLVFGALGMVRRGGYESAYQDGFAAGQRAAANSESSGAKGGSGSETAVPPQTKRPTPVGQTAVSTPHTPLPTPNTATPAPLPPPPADPNGTTPTRLIFGQTTSSFGRRQTKRQPAPSAQLSLFG